MGTPIFQSAQIGHANLLDLSPISANGIVSKPLIQETGVKQILFAMDKGQTISEHRAPFLATVHVLDGQLELKVDGATYQLSTNDWVTMPPNAAHDLIALETVRFLLTMIKLESN